MRLFSRSRNRPLVLLRSALFAGDEDVDEALKKLAADALDAEADDAIDANVVFFLHHLLIDAV